MKKLLILLVLVAIIVGCSDDGKLKVKNETNDYIWVSVSGGEFNDITSNDSYTKKWSMKKSIFNVEEKNVSISYEGWYVFDDNDDVKVTAGKTKSVNIDANCGGIRVYNYSPYSITQAYASPSSSDYWGSNDLNNSVSTNDYCHWQVSSGYWDIKIIDAGGYEGYAYDIYVSINDTESFHFDGPFQKVENNNLNFIDCNLSDRKINGIETDFNSQDNNSIHKTRLIPKELIEFCNNMK